MGTSGQADNDWELVHKLYDIYLYLVVTSINVFCADGLCFRVLLLKILWTKRFSCVETLLKTHKQRLQKKKIAQDVIYRIIRSFNSFIMETSGHADNW